MRRHHRRVCAVLSGVAAAVFWTINVQARAVAAFVPVPLPKPNLKSVASNGVYHALGGHSGSSELQPGDTAQAEARFRELLKQSRTASEVVEVLRGAAANLSYDDPDSSTSSIVKGVSPNVAALALRKLVDVSCRSRAARDEASIDDADREVAAQYLVALLKNVGGRVAMALTPNESSEKHLISLYSLSDILVALGALSAGEGKMVPLATKVCLLLEKQPDQLTKTLGPKRLIDMLDSLSALRLRRPFLLALSYDRLEKGDALSVLSSRDLTTALRAMTVLDCLHESGMKAFMRRWRKKVVREKADIRDVCQMISVARRLSNLNEARDDGAVDDLYGEAETLVHTLLREISCRHTAFTGAEPNCRSLSVAQTAEVLSACASFDVNSTHPTLNVVCADIRNDKTWQRATLADITRILASLQSLGATHYPNTSRLLGERFLDLVDRNPTAVPPRTANTILRSSVLLHSGDRDVLVPFSQAAHLLFCDEKFLARCDSAELANFAWFLSRARQYDVDALNSLVQKLLEADFVEACSPKLACRTIVALTSLIMRNSVESENSAPRTLLSELFHALGTHLLSTQLTASETSSALVAYARASYIQDMGIFDHLTKSLEARLDECTNRQIAQSLWACGKMVVWESDQHSEIDDDSALPYLSSARQYASYLSARAKQLNAKDVSQCLWALACLGTDDLTAVYAFAFRASQLAEDCNSQELANILWGLSRLGYEGPEVVTALVTRILHPSIIPNPQESANILYGLGRMEFRDDKVFAKLSDAMMAQLDDASAQAIANALWAHRAVHITPPQELLDRWAIKKLGLISVPPGLIEGK